MERLLFSYPGQFRWWTYTVSHGQLLLRRPRSPEHTGQVDVLFKDVGHVNLPTSLSGLMVLESDRRDLITGANHEGRRLFIVRGEGIEGFVVAGAVFHDQGDRDYHDPSPLLPSLPPVSSG